MNKSIIFLISLLYTVLSTPVVGQAEIRLPAVFGDNMVLQRETDAAIWGMASPRSTVTLTTSWDGRDYSVKADGHGSWKVTVRTPVAGGPYEITISDGSKLTLSNVLIGEVWFCSGQSNMEMSMKGFRNQPVDGANRDIATSTNPHIRLITVKKNTNVERLSDFEGKWLECTPASVSNFSATAYYFGRFLQQALGVPVGLICSSWGGTRIEPWMSEQAFEKFDFVKLPAKDKKENITAQTPTVLFNAMVNPVKGYGMRGAIWYQGESNRLEYDNYGKLLPGLVDNWRKEWGIGEFPFYYVQIAPYDYGVTTQNSAFLREVQLKAATALPAMGMACLMDVGEKDCIHPANKQAAGERLAFIALAKTYGANGLAWSGPVLKDMVVDGSVVKLTFDHAPNGLTSSGKELINFKVAGDNKRFFPAKAFITNEGVTIFSASVSKPVAVRYAFEDFVVGDLFNTEGLPASSFRTDDWE